MRLFLLLFALFEASFARELLQIQALWRHGDRAPAKTFETDPHQADTWPVPWGELTNKGMWQHYVQGLKMKAEYIDRLQLVGPKYSSKEIYVRSTDSSRALMSAYANMAGFYSESNGTHPAEFEWPSNWTPVPVHTVRRDNDYALWQFSECARRIQLRKWRKTLPGFVDFMRNQATFLEEVSEKTKWNVSDLHTFVNLANILAIERKYNLSFPSWISDDVYKKVQLIGDRAWDFMFGGGGFSVPSNDELIAINGGVLLSEMIRNINDSVNGTSALRYHAYSGHDTSVSALLRTFGAKDAIVGGGQPDYASIIVVELWELREKDYGIRVVYSDNAGSPFRVVTHFLNRCQGREFCSLESFARQCGKYVVDDIKKICTVS
ncbi:hypothetical protein QR680_017705 [Steinernema hermaphroditum]|uniref:Acid phosphatase n=1 Tax=Steinernema hermaphroditum TaxID=289476 RepID=A0AA39LPV6_9BILA|nr:hypothetical protein QR680_017705 [Steinernema hermaphroditum]